LARLLALIVSAALSLPLISPVLSIAGEPNLPSCCRRDGKHHCARPGMAGASRASTPVIHGSPAQCPLFPSGKSIPVAAKAATPVPVRLAFRPPVSGPAAVEQIEVQYRLSLYRASQDRGPPSLLS